MKKYIVSIMIPMTITSFIVIFTIPVNTKAQTVNCPSGYTCTPVAPQPAGCPIGYTCTPANVSSPSPVAVSSATNSCYQIPNLYLGSTGDNVTNLQTYLMNNGYDIPAVSSGRTTKGYYGNQTVSAIAQYKMSSKYQKCFGTQNQTTVSTVTTNPVTYTPPVSNSSTQTSINIVSPNGGSFQAGSTLNVQWNYSGNISADNTYYFVYLKQTPNQILGSTQSISYTPLLFRVPKVSFPNFSVVLPSDQSSKGGSAITPGTYYLEFDYTDSGANVLASVTSNAFMITNTGSPANTNQSITVTVPQAGNTLDNSNGKGNNFLGYINWSSTGLGNNPVGINLLSSTGSVVKNIVASVSNTGSYTWAYDPTIPNGTYAVQVYVAGKGTGLGSSGYFQITGSPANTNQSITVTVPQAGNTLDNSNGKGNNFLGYINWSSTGLGNNPVGINLLSSTGSVVKNIVASVSNTGSYTWAYDPTIPNGTYAVQVYVAGKGTGLGSSGYFQITGSPANTNQSIIEI